MNVVNPPSTNYTSVGYRGVMSRLPELDNSEVSHKTISNPLFRRPLTNLCRKEKAIRISSESATDQCRRYSKGVWTFLLGFYHWIFRQ